MLSQELAKMKIVEFDHPLQGLDKFDPNLQKFNKVSRSNKMPDELAIMYLRSATHSNKELLSAWAQCEIMNEAVNKPAPTYDEYYAYMLKYAKKLEAAVTNNTTSRKANSAESNYLSPYSPSDECYNDATKLLSYMGDQGNDVDMVQDVLICNQALKQEKPRPPSCSRCQEPLCKELQIKEPTWSELEAKSSHG